MVDLEAAGRELRHRQDVQFAPVEELARRATRRRHRRRAWRMVLAVMVVAGVGVIGVRGGDDRDHTNIATEAGQRQGQPAELVVVPQLVDLDYVVAQQRVAEAGITAPDVRVLLALDLNSEEPLGVVTRTDPPASAPVVDDTLIIWVAATREDLGAVGPPGRGLVVSNIMSPPAGLDVGTADLYAGQQDPGECAARGPEMRAVRFIRGELVGCFGSEFIWLDHFRRNYVEGG